MQLLQKGYPRMVKDDHDGEDCKRKAIEDVTLHVDPPRTGRSIYRGKESCNAVASQKVDRAEHDMAQNVCSALFLLIVHHSDQKDQRQQEKIEIPPD